jgi:hypothetical protein
LASTFNVAVGASSEPLSLVWAATLLTNIYTGLVIFFEVTRDTPMTVAQVTVLGTLMALGHSLPIEGAVARRWRLVAGLAAEPELLAGRLAPVR